LARDFQGGRIVRRSPSESRRRHRAQRAGTRRSARAPARRHRAARRAAVPIRGHGGPGRRIDARANAKRAQECEVLERREAAQIAELTRQLDEERRKSAEIAAEFSRYRDSVAQKLAEHARREDPWTLLAQAISQILSQWVAWLRAKIPAESAFLPWFDRAVEFAKLTGELAWKSAKALFEWGKPHACELWSRLKGEVAQRRPKE